MQSQPPRRWDCFHPQVSVRYATRREILDVHAKRDTTAFPTEDGHT